MPAGIGSNGWIADLRRAAQNPIFEAVANGSGLPYMHSGMYGRGSVPDAPTADPGTKISVCHGVGGMFAAAGTIVMSNEPP